jgi:hypothetical protein
MIGILRIRIKNNSIFPENNLNKCHQNSIVISVANPDPEGIFFRNPDLGSRISFTMIKTKTLFLKP